jgi:acetylornithine deacetylase
VERELKRLLAGCREADPVLEASARTLLVREPLETAEDEPVVAALREAAAEVLGSRPPLSGASFWADSAFIAGAGIPTALFGPGGEGAHAAEEWVSIRDTEGCARILTRAASAFCA